LAWDNRKLHEAGRFKLDMMWFHAAVDERVVLRHGYAALEVNDDDVYFELTRLDEVLERFKPKKPPSQKGPANG
jgi:hypothetical protein